jgi:16S rRNA (cytosine967-C5)-methyltransferase
MQPSARLAAAIELLDSIEAAIVSRGMPADRIVSDYFRARRYAGSKDKRAISDLVYAVLRSRELLVWALSKGALSLSGRSLLLAHLSAHDAGSLALLGADDGFAPPALSADERAGVHALQVLDWCAAPEAAQLNVPGWAEEGLRARFGGGFASGAAALGENAPLDIRLNTLRARGKDINSCINISPEDIEKHKFSPSGFRIKARINLGAEKAYRDGLVEVQDEAAQIASSLVGARAGHQVIELCAGAGGKSLAIAAEMENRGQIHAFDISGKRLADFRTRLKRAGVHNIQVIRLAAEGEGRADALKPFAGSADRVVVDVPCTGSGTWRRSPDQRWRFDTGSLAELNRLQASLLGEAAALVRPGGRLYYMTCSLLPQENEAIIQSFMGYSGSDWQLLDYREVWQETLASEAPETLSSLPSCLQLAPHAHDTDGFFVAVLERQA